MVWFTGLAPSGQYHLAEALRPGKWGHWTDADIVAISRALRRLEQRGLLIRNPEYAKRCTMSVVLTPKGNAVAESIRPESITDEEDAG
jgi:hypothetical protein